MLSSGPAINFAFLHKYYSHLFSIGSKIVGVKISHLVLFEISNADQASLLPASLQLYPTM